MTRHEGLAKAKEVLAKEVRKNRRPTKGIHKFMAKWKDLPVKETSARRTKDREAWKKKIEGFQLFQSTGTLTV